MEPKPQVNKPTTAPTPKPTMKFEVVGDNVVITIPKKDLTKKLLDGLI